MMTLFNIAVSTWLIVLFWVCIREDMHERKQRRLEDRIGGLK